jgi:hypothetical protein
MSQFGIGDVSVVIDILRNHLYKNKIQIMVQEYLCNARDAHREAKQTKPIDIKMIGNVFSVQDFGPGISPDRMENVFIKYGNSTKRDGVQTGGFGIGAKSGWAYTDSFDIVTVTKENDKLVQRTYRASVKDNKQGELNLLETSDYIKGGETGTSIKIRIKDNEADYDKFCSAIQRAVYFWKESERPTCNLKLDFFEPSIKIGDLEITECDDSSFECVQEEYNTRRALFVMDGVPYIHYHSVFSDVITRIAGRAAINLDPAQVDVSASRESISDTPKTESYFKTHSAKLKANLYNFVNTKMKVKDIKEFAKAIKDLAQYVNIQPATKFNNFVTGGTAIDHPEFKNINMTSHAEYERQRRRRRFGYGKPSTYGNDEFKVAVNEIQNIALDDVHEVFYKDNDSETKMISNRRIKEYIQTNNNSIVLLERKPANEVRQAVANVNAFQQLVIDLQAKPLSSLPVTPIVRTRKPKEEIAADTSVTYHKIWCERKSPTTTDVKRLVDDKFIYVRYDEFDDKAKLASEVSEFVNNGDWGVDYEMITLTDKMLNKMKEHNIELIEMNDWLNTYNFSQEAINTVKFRCALNTSAMRYLEPSIAMVKDPFVKQMIKEYSESIVNCLVPVPPLLFGTLKSRYHSQFLIDDEKLNELFKTKYSLAKTIAASNNELLRDELVNYMNSKV